MPVAAGEVGFDEESVIEDVKSMQSEEEEDDEDEENKGSEKESDSEAEDSDKQGRESRRQVARSE